MKQLGRPRAAGRRTSRARVQAAPAGRNGQGPRGGREVERLQDELAIQRSYAEGDLAARRDLESRLAQYADLYDFAPVGHVTFDFHGRILEMNLTGAGMIGYDRLETINRPFLPLLEQEDRRRWLRYLTGFRQNGFNQKTIELRVSPRHGGRRPVIQLFTVRTTSADQPVLRAAFFDVTGRYDAEEALRDNEQRYRTIVETAGEGVVLTGTDGTYTFANRRMAEMLGRTEEELRGRSSLDFVFEEDRPRAEEAREILRRGRGAHGEIRFLRADGSALWMLYSASPILNERGEHVADVVMHTDITERHRAEERVLASLREKEVLLREIHHRVKNNLQVVSSLIDLQSGAFAADTTVREVFRDMRDRVRAMALVHERLYETEDFGHLEFSAYASMLARDIWQAHAAERAGLRLDLQVSPVVLSVETAIPCGLILNELVVNAVKHAFRDRSEGCVRIELKQGAKRLVSLRVVDDGAGLPPGVNWRESSSLGLRLVRMLAAQLRGSIEANSVHGTEFHLTFTPPKIDGSTDHHHG